MEALVHHGKENGIESTYEEGEECKLSDSAHPYSCATVANERISTTLNNLHVGHSLPLDMLCQAVDSWKGVYVCNRQVLKLSVLSQFRHNLRRP